MAEIESATVQMQVQQFATVNVPDSVTFSFAWHEIDAAIQEPLDSAGIQKTIDVSKDCGLGRRYIGGDRDCHVCNSCRLSSMHHTGALALYISLYESQSFAICGGNAAMLADQLLEIRL